MNIKFKFTFSIYYGILRFEKSSEDFVDLIYMRNSIITTLICLKGVAMQVGAL